MTPVPNPLLADEIELERFGLETHADTARKLGHTAAADKIEQGLKLIHEAEQAIRRGEV